MRSLAPEPRAQDMQSPSASAVRGTASGPQGGPGQQAAGPLGPTSPRGTTDGEEPQWAPDRGGCLTGGGDLAGLPEAPAAADLQRQGDLGAALPGGQSVSFEDLPGLATALLGVEPEAVESVSSPAAGAFLSCGSDGEERTP